MARPAWPLSAVETGGSEGSEVVFFFPITGRGPERIGRAPVTLMSGTDRLRLSARSAPAPVRTSSHGGGSSPQDSGRTEWWRSGWPSRSPSSRVVPAGGLVSFSVCSTASSLSISAPGAKGTAGAGRGRKRAVKAPKSSRVEFGSMRDRIAKYTIPTINDTTMTFQAESMKRPRPDSDVVRPPSIRIESHPTRAEAAKANRNRR